MRRGFPISIFALGASALGALALAFAPLACDNDDSDDGDGGVVVSDLGVCPTSYDASAGKFPHSALPSGETCGAGTSCHMPIDDCASDWSETPVGENLDEYECLCTSGAWVCTLSTKVDTICGEAGTAAVDGGQDAETDAADAMGEASVEASGDAGIDANDASTFDASDGSLDASDDASE